MGNSTFCYVTYRDHVTSTTLRSDGSLKSIGEVFSQRGVSPALDPKGIMVRESRDSEANPNSRPLIIALDVTGSMGFIAEAIAREKLENLMHGVLDTKPIDDPHIMFMAIGDAAYDYSPLQVSQFEADIRIAQQLQDIYLEGKGGGNDTESYDLAWYFAANHTSIDSFEKRGKKGYLVTVGDENPPSAVQAAPLRTMFGNSQLEGFSSKDVLAAADKQWEIFHIIVEEGNFAKRDKGGVYEKWSQLLGTRAIRLSNYHYIAEVITAIMLINEGKSVESVIEEATSSELQDVLRHAFPLFEDSQQNSQQKVGMKSYGPGIRGERGTRTFRSVRGS